MTANPFLKPNVAQSSFFTTADQVTVYQLDKTDLDALATGANGANISIKFNLLEEFETTSAFDLEIRKASPTGSVVTSISTAENPLFAESGELRLSANVYDDAKYFLIVKPSDEDGFTDAQFEIILDEVPTFGGVVANSLISSNDIVALEEVYVGTDIDNTSVFSNSGDKTSFLLDLNEFNQDRDITLTYSGPMTKIEVFKLTDESSSSAKTISNSSGSSATSQSVGVIYTVSEVDNKVTVARSDDKQFTANFSIGDNSGVVSIPDAVTSSISNGKSSATFEAISGDAAENDTITLTIVDENEIEVSRSFTAKAETTLSSWVDEFIKLFSEDSITFTSGAAAETLKIVFSETESDGSFTFRLSSAIDPTATDQQNRESDLALLESQSLAPLIRIGDLVSSDFKISQKVGAQTSTDLSFTTGSTYRLSDFIKIDGDYDAVYLSLEKISEANDTPELIVAINGTDLPISASATPTLIKKSDFLDATFTAGASATTPYNLTAFARKLTGQNKSSTYTIDSNVNDWFSDNVTPDQTDSSGILQASIAYIDTIIETIVLDNKYQILNNGALLEGTIGFLQVDVSNFVKSDNSDDNLLLNVSVATNDISFVDPSSGNTSKSKTIEISDKLTDQIRFWVVTDSDFLSSEVVTLNLEVSGAETLYGENLSNLVIDPTTFTVSELIPTLTTNYTDASALLPNDITSVFKYKITLDNFDDLKVIDDAILLKPTATSNASKFQIEAYSIIFDDDAEKLNIASAIGSLEVTAKVEIDGSEEKNAYENGLISTDLLYGSEVTLELSAEGLPTAIYAFSAPQDASVSAWTTAISNAFSGFRFVDVENEPASEIEVAVYSLADDEDAKASSLIEHSLIYNGKTFESADLSIPNVQVTTNLGSNESWTSSGTSKNDAFRLNLVSANITAGSGDDTLNVDTIPTIKSSIFDAGADTDTINFINSIENYTIQLSSSGDIKVTDLSSLGTLIVKNTEKFSFENLTYDLLRVDGAVSSYDGGESNDLYLVSTNTPTIKDTGSSENNDIVISTVSYDASKHSGIESVFLSGDDNLSASLDGSVILHGNSGDNIITLSSSDDVIYSSSGLDYVNDSNTVDLDTFILAKPKENYNFYSSNNKFFVTGDGGTSVLENVEKIAFSGDISNSVLISELTFSTPSSTDILPNISVSVSGDYIETSTLSANFVDAVSKKSIPGSETFAWYETGSNSVLSTENQLILGAQNIDKSIYAVATYLDDTGTLRNTASQSKIVSYFDDPTSGVIALSGSLAVGSKLTADVLAFSDLDFEGSSIPAVSSYQWFSNDEKIVGASSKDLEIDQAIKNSKLSVELGFINSFGDLEYLKSSNSDVVFLGRDNAPISVGSNELFVINNSIATTSQTIGEQQSDFEDFFLGQETSQYSYILNQPLGSNVAFDELNLDVSTSTSVISDPENVQAFQLIGDQDASQNLAVFLDMENSASGFNLNASYVHNIALKGEGTIVTDDSPQHVFAGKSDQKISTGSGNDKVFSGAGDDVLNLGEGYNVAYAGTGDDTIIIPFDFDENYIGYVSPTHINIDNGISAFSIFDAEYFTFSDGSTYTEDQLQALNLGNKNFSALGTVEINGVAKIGNKLSLIDKTFDTNGTSSETVLYQWLRGNIVIDGENSTTYTLTAEDVGAQITVKKIFEDNLGNENVIVSEGTSFVKGLRTNLAGTSQSDTFVSTADSEAFYGGQGADIFKFVKVENASQGDDLIEDYDANVDVVLTDGYALNSYERSLDSSGNDYFVFTEDAGESSVTIEASEVATSLKIKNLSSKNLQIDGVDFNVGVDGDVSLASKTSVDDVKVEGLNSFKTGLRKSGETNASDPINLSDVLAQLKHIVGLKELKANALQAGDSNNDGTVNLSDVLGNLKHIIGLKEIDSFDLVTDNGFAINSLNADSNGNLTLVINGDADQSHADWDLA